MNARSRVRYYVRTEHIGNFVSDDNVALFCKNCKFGIGQLILVQGQRVADFVNVTPRPYTVNIALLDNCIQKCVKSNGKFMFIFSVS